MKNSWKKNVVKTPEAIFKKSQKKHPEQYPVGMPEKKLQE